MFPPSATPRHATSGLQEDHIYLCNITPRKKETIDFLNRPIEDRTGLDTFIHTRNRGTSNSTGSIFFMGHGHGYEDDYDDDHCMVVTLTVTMSRYYDTRTPQLPSIPTVAVVG